MQRSKNVLVGLALMGALTSASRQAQADWDLQIATQMGGGWLRDTPDFEAANTFDTSARTIHEGSVARTHGGLGMMGLGMDTELTIDDRWRVPLVGGAMWWAMGDSNSETTGLDGSVAHLRPWSTLRGDILLPGLGRRFKYRREMVAIAIRTGVSFMRMNGTVAAGPDLHPVDLTAGTILLEAEVEACRRLDPTERICLVVAPRLYEYRWLNGVTIGLRVEWGR